VERLYVRDAYTQLLRVRDPERAWWADTFVFATRLSDGAIAGGSARPLLGDDAGAALDLGSLEGDWLARVDPGGDQAAPSLMLTPLQGEREARRWPLAGSGVVAMARSAHGRWLAALGEEPSSAPVHLIDTHGKGPALSLPLPAASACAGPVQLLAFAWDGASLWGSTPCGLVRWPLPANGRDPAAGSAAPDGN
jgi:hypothetical protein